MVRLDSVEAAHSQAARRCQLGPSPSAESSGIAPACSAAASARAACTAATASGTCSASASALPKHMAVVYDFGSERR